MADNMDFTDLLSSFDELGLFPFVKSSKKKAKSSPVSLCDCVVSLCSSILNVCACLCVSPTQIVHNPCSLVLYADWSSPAVH